MLVHQLGHIKVGPSTWPACTAESTNNVLILRWWAGVVSDSFFYNFYIFQYISSIYVSQSRFKKASFLSASWLHQESMERTFLSARNWHKDCDQCNFQQVFWVLIKMSSNPFYFDLSWWQNGLMTVPSITLRMLTIRMMMQINANHLYNSEIVRKDGVQCWAWNRIALHPLSFIEFPFYNRFLSSLWEPALDSIAILFAEATSTKGQCGGGGSRNASVRCLDLLVAWSSSPKDLIVHGPLTFDHLIHRLHLWPYSALTVKPFIELILISRNSQCLALFFPMLLLWHLKSAA